MQVPYGPVAQCETPPSSSELVTAGGCDHDCVGSTAPEHDDRTAAVYSIQRPVRLVAAKVGDGDYVAKD